MALKQSYKQYRNIKGKHYQFWTANGGIDGFLEEKAQAKKDGVAFRIIDRQFYREVKDEKK